MISLAAKTTCKNCWRQITNEADCLKDKPKYLCTLQRGISGAQMQTANVVLVVPKPYIKEYSADRQERIWTIGRFVKYVQEIESIHGH